MSTLIVKQGSGYVAYPPGFVTSSKAEWTNEQSLAWRWVGLDSGNGARLTARKIGHGARVVRLVKRSAPSGSAGER